MASEREQISRKVALIALIANLILMAGKVFLGWQAIVKPCLQTEYIPRQMSLLRLQSWQ